NQMLADLDRRGALAGSEAATLDLRPVAPGRRPAVVPMLALAAAIAIAGTWLSTAGPSPRRSPQPAAAPPAAAPVRSLAGPAATADPPDMSLRLSVLPPPPEARPAPARKPPVPVAPRSQEAAAAPSAVAAPSGAARPRAPAPVTVAGAEPAIGTAVLPAAKSTASAAPDPAIDKRMYQPTPRQRAEAEFSRAVALMQQGRAGEAMDGLNSALQIFQGYDAARQVLAALLVEARRTAEAEQVLEEGVRLNTGNARLALALARIQVERGGWEAALDTLRRSETAAAGDADYQGLMGSVLQRLSRHAEAIPCYIAAVRLAPQSGLWYMGLGISLEAEGRTADARESFQRARAAGTLSPELVAFIDQRLAGLAPRPRAASSEQ
ncbi:MAG TPA: tetratricopeptide repeat protein, partial [Burkholderiales bacterium]